jgi:hypothetical protein
MTPQERKRLADRIRAIPHNGWWHVDGEETFVRLAVELVDAGLTADKAVDVLEWAYGAVAGEFGS